MKKENQIIDALFANARMIDDLLRENPSMISDYIKYRIDTNSYDYLDLQIKNLLNLQKIMYLKNENYKQDVRFQSFNVAKPIQSNDDELFIAKFKDDLFISKKHASEFAGRTQQWIQHHLDDKFKHDNRGVELKSYLSWLKFFDYKAFTELKKKCNDINHALPKDQRIDFNF